MKTAVVLLLLLAFFSIVIMIFRLLVEANVEEKGTSDTRAIYENRVIHDDSIDKNSIKYLYGVPVSTKDELDEWCVVKGFSDALCGHLNELMRIADEGKSENYAALIEDWNTYYGRLRALCIRHKLWNGMLDDRQIFYPTEKQLDLEDKLHKRFMESCELGIDKAFMDESGNKEILDFLHTQPKQEIARRKLVNALASGDPEKRKQYRQLCRNMVRDGILAEKHDDSGALIVKKKRNRKRAQKTVELEPSTFSPALYGDIDRRKMYKVKHTVGTPENLDRVGNRCEFTSLSRGERYHTSLQCCTCVAFKNGDKPCKHMVALAKYLRYI